MNWVLMLILRKEPDVQFAAVNTFMQSPKNVTPNSARIQIFLANALYLLNLYGLFYFLEHG